MAENKKFPTYKKVGVICFVTVLGVLFLGATTWFLIWLVSMLLSVPNIGWIILAIIAAIITFCGLWILSSWTDEWMQWSETHKKEVKNGRE